MALTGIQTRLPYVLLASSILLVALPHLARLPLWMAGVLLLVIGWRGLHDLARWPLPPRWLRLLLVITTIIGIAVSYRTIVGREAGSALLLAMMCLKLLETHSQRDVYVVIFLGFFVVVTGFLFSQSIFIGTYMFLVVVLLVTTLITFQHTPGTAFNRSVLRQDLSRAGRLTLQALPLALILFVLFPRIPGPLWGLPKDSSTGRTGLSDEMQPGLISQLVDSTEVAFRVNFHSAPPPVDQRYWRGPVLWHYDGRRWTSNKNNTPIRAELDYRHRGEAVEYSVTLEPHDRHWLFALDLPARIPADALLTSELQLITRKPVKDVYRYEMASQLDYELDVQTPLKLNNYTTLPATAAPRSRALMAELARDSAGPAELVQRVLRYFQAQPFFYSRQPPLLFDDPVDEFVFETRKGYCEHYASAFTVMMRAAGIPARVVTGYYGGEMNPLSDYMIIRQSDAHAWSEVWLAGQGWVRIDPTSVIPPERIELTADLIQRQPELRADILKELNWLRTTWRQAGFMWDAVNNRWNQWVIGYNQARQSAFFSALGLPNLTWRGMAFMLAGFATAIILLTAVLLLRKKTFGSVRSVTLYRVFLRKLRRLGFDKAGAETPQAFARRVAQQRSELAEIVDNITYAYQQLRYANPAQPETLLRQFKQALRLLPAR